MLFSSTIRLCCGSIQMELFECHKNLVSVQQSGLHCLIILSSILFNKLLLVFLYIAFFKYFVFDFRAMELGRECLSLWGYVLCVILFLKIYPV